jgi:predicted GTPase
MIEIQITSSLFAMLTCSPNVGKSSLFNRLVGESKSLITPIPGTTRYGTGSLLGSRARDRIYGVVEWADRDFILVDTGGIDLRLFIINLFVLFIYLFISLFI